MEAVKLTRSTEPPLHVEAVYGGTHVATDLQRLRQRPVHLLVATAGRLRMHVDSSLSSDGRPRRPLISLASVKTFVLDEADRLLEDLNNEADHLQFILRNLPKGKSSPLFPFFKFVPVFFAC